LLKTWKLTTIENFEMLQKFRGVHPREKKIEARNAIAKFFKLIDFFDKGKKI